MDLSRSAISAVSVLIRTCIPDSCFARRLYVDALPRGDFGLSDLEWQQLRTQINTWRNELERLSADDSRPDPTRFPELGW